MTPSRPKDTPTNLLRELENLQKVLDGFSDDSFDATIPILEPIADDIPVLNEFFEDKKVNALKAVAKASVPAPAPTATTPKARTEPPVNIPTLGANQMIHKPSGNPFLPQSMLDKLTVEREAAQHSAEEAHRTMQKVMEQKQQRAQTGLAGLGKELSNAQKDKLITQMVEEMLPQIAERLRDKLKIMLSR